MKKSLVIINACVRQADSRTLRIAEPVLEARSTPGTVSVIIPLFSHLPVPPQDRK